MEANHNEAYVNMPIDSDYRIKSVERKRNDKRKRESLNGSMKKFHAQLQTLKIAFRVN